MMIECRMKKLIVAFVVSSTLLGFAIGGCKYNVEAQWEPSDLDKYIKPPIKVDMPYDGRRPSLIQTQNESFMMVFVSLTWLYEPWATHDIQITTSNDGINWTKSKRVIDKDSDNFDKKITRDFPSLIQLQNDTFMISYLYFEGFFPMRNYSVRIITSKDGVNWSTPIRVSEDYNVSCYYELKNGILLPRIATRLYQMNDGILVIGGDPYFYTSWNGVNWTKEENPSNIQTFKQLTKDRIKTLNGKYMRVEIHANEISDMQYNLTGIYIRVSEDGDFWSNPIQITGNDTSNPSLIQAKDGRYIVAFSFSREYREPYVVIFEDSDLTVTYPSEDLFFTYLVITLAILVIIGVFATLLLLRRRMKRE